MRIKIIIAVVALQIAVLGWMAGEREWILRNGETIYFRTAPIDPRDPFRGDYVRLRYDMSVVPKSLLRGKLADMDLGKLPTDTIVFASLELDQDKVAKLVSVALERPESGLFIRGRTEKAGNRLRVRYGLETFFTEQGKGLDLERGRSQQGIQVPLEMKASVSASGIAVLKDHRWCALGMGFVPLTNEVTRPDGPRRIVGAKVRLLNASSNALAIVDLPEGRSLALVPEHSWTENPWNWAPSPAAPMKPEAAHVVLLQPGQVHGIHVSLKDPYWTVSKADNQSGQPVAVADFTQDWSRFRFEYRPPSAEACAHLPHANLIWHGTLLSPAFTPTGSVD